MEGWRMILGLAIQKEPTIPKVDKLRVAAQEYSCVLCGKDKRHTVAAHCNDAQYKGMWRKAPGYMLAYVCGDPGGCHDQIDGRSGGLTKQAKREMWNEAHKRTVRLWFLHGHVAVS
jgi:hypothetical protein